MMSKGFMYRSWLCFFYGRNTAQPFGTRIKENTAFLCPTERPPALPCVGVCRDELCPGFSLLLVTPVPLWTVAWRVGPQILHIPHIPHSALCAEQATPLLSLNQQLF